MRGSFLNAGCYVKYSKIRNVANWRKRYDPISRYTCTIYFTTLKSDARDCSIPCSVLVMFAMQVECV